MNVYLTASTKRIIKEKAIFREVLEILKDFGFKNTNEYLGDIITNKLKIEEHLQLHKETVRRIKSSALVICDVSDPSVTLGSLIEVAINHHVPVLCLYENKYEERVPTLIKNYSREALKLKVFSKNNLKEILTNFLESFKKSRIKFNVFIDSKINDYMEWYSERHKTSKAELFRGLILEKMKKDKNYNSTK